VSDIIKTICKALDLGKILWAGNKGKNLRKLADKTDIEVIAGLRETLKKGAYDRFMLASKTEGKVMVGAGYTGG